MELKITAEKENALFNRKEVAGLSESEITPSRVDTLKALSEKFKVPEENIKIKGINGKFGSKTFHLEANIYSSEEEKNKTELKKKKDAPAPVKQEEAPAATPAPAEAEPAKEEAKPEEKSTEDKTEEPKEEVKEAKPEGEK